MKNLKTNQASLEKLVNYLVYFNLMYSSKTGQELLANTKELVAGKVLTQNPAGKVILHSFAIEETIQDLAEQQILLQVLEGEVEVYYEGIQKEAQQGMMVSIPAGASYVMVVKKDSKLLKLEAYSGIMPQKHFAQCYPLLG